MDDFMSLKLPAVLPALLLVSLPALAQDLPDPTRPPESLLSQRGVAGAMPAVATPSGPQLQSVLIARHSGGRHVAVIDGQMLKLGDKYKGAVLTRMTEHEVVLVSGTTRQVLKLYPAPAAQK